MQTATLNGKLALIMARGIPVTLHARVLAKKGDATIYFQDMLKRYDVGRRVNPDDAKDLLAILQHHADREKKIGVGVNHFTVGISEEFKSKCFYVVRLDGSTEDFSFHHCISNYK